MIHLAYSFAEIQLRLLRMGTFRPVPTTPNHSTDIETEPQPRERTAAPRNISEIRGAEWRSP